MGCQVSEGGIQNQPYFWQKSPKEFSTFKCNVGNWIFSKSLDFLGITKSYSNMDGINMFVKILVFVKILGKGRRRKEGRKISIFRSASASSSHLKKILGETF